MAVQGCRDRLTRVTKLLALAIHFDHLINAGAVISQAELARLGQVSRHRLPQIVNLLHLAPNIQHPILHLPLLTSGRGPITEREIQRVSCIHNWEKQANRKRCSDFRHDEKAIRCSQSLYPWSIIY
ncbi:hypothetical protein Q31a_42200 [Aureliella helgolandensis]|uniref:Uncharacterized protein n=1 Tax=Aureliella helgolandensis TaxID=2527968 RepID=A0A518GBA6_9BACT|nr:hypothetical protein Q31a_42200 [Aureliella helgolandensis]